VPSLVGDIDLANAAAHGDELCAVLDVLDGTVLHVDCSQLDLLEPRGMAMMVRVHRHGVERGIDVVWDGLASRHRDAAALTGLADYVWLGPEDPDGV
jgi:anti-anti-sigma regulatory factor